MVLRPGEEAKLTPEQEKELLEQLRAEREAKAHVKLQADAQSLAMTLGALELNEVPAKAKELASDKKKFGGESKAAAMAIFCVAREMTSGRDAACSASFGRTRSRSWFRCFSSCASWNWPFAYRKAKKPRQTSNVIRTTSASSRSAKFIDNRVETTAPAVEPTGPVLPAKSVKWVHAQVTL